MKKLLVAFCAGVLPGACMFGSPAFATRVEVQCRPVVKPDLPDCGLPAYFKYGYSPDRCHNA